MLSREKLHPFLKPRESVVEVQNGRIPVCHAAQPHLADPSGLAYLHPDCHLRSNFFSVFGAAAAPFARDSRRGYGPFRIPRSTATTATRAGGRCVTRASAQRQRNDRTVKRTSSTPWLQFPKPDDMFYYDEWPRPGDDVVLLYHGANNVQCGDLWFHLDRGLCCWADPEDPVWPAISCWVPLELALRRYLDERTRGGWRLVPEPGYL